MKICYAAVLHFDNAAGMLYKDDPKRRARTIENPRWWPQRQKILERFVFPSLNAQTFKKFDVWGLFRKGTEKLSRDLRASLKILGCTMTHDGPQAIRNFYKDKCDLLVLIHHDSDDMFSKDAFKLFSQKHKNHPGRVMFFEVGYIYDYTSGRMGEYWADDGCPPAFHAMVYDNYSLQSERNWNEFRHGHGLQVFHHQLRKIPKKVILPPWNFVQAVHGTNTTTAWKNRHTINKVKRMIVDEDEKAKVLAKFGVTADVRI